MEMPDLKKLAKVLDLCRKKGVSSIAIGDLKIELREQLPESGYKKRVKNKTTETIDTDNPYANFPEGDLTPEQLMFYSSGGDPADDPALQGLEQ